MNDLVTLRANVAQIEPESTPEFVAEVWNRVAVTTKALRELKDRLEEAMLEYVTANGPLTIGELKFYAGTEKKAECTDKRGAMMALLDACDDDAELLEVLVSQPYKFAAARTALGDRYPEFFRVETVPDLKTGVGKKVLKQANTPAASADWDGSVR